jgi:hypothetical protein
MADLTLGPGPIWISPEPRCPVHGQMREDLAASAWTCAGWDGEGCDHVVRNEDREPVLIGIAGPMTIRGVTRG